MSRFLSAPFDIQCLTLGQLTLWWDILKVLNLYQDSPQLYNQALGCIKQILRNHNALLRHTPRISFFTQLIKMTRVEIVDHLVTFETDLDQNQSRDQDQNQNQNRDQDQDQNQGLGLDLINLIESQSASHVNTIPSSQIDTGNLYSFDSLNYLMELTIEFPTDMFYNPNSVKYDQLERAFSNSPIIKFITQFFQSPLRQQRGHLIYYIQKRPLYDYIKIANVEDNNYTYQLLHRIGEINLQTGKYQGFINRYWLEFLGEILPHFVIRQLRLVTINRYSFTTFVDQINLSPRKADQLHRWIVNHLNFLSNILSPVYPIMHFSNLDLHHLELCPQNLTPTDTLEFSNDTEGTYKALKRWILHSPHLKEISMSNSPQFKRFTGHKFIKEAIILSNFFDQRILHNFLNDGILVLQPISVRIFFTYFSIVDLFKLFPNLTRFYYVVPPAVNPDRIRNDLSNIVINHPHIVEIMVFLENPTQTNDYANYFSRYHQLKFVLV